MTRQLYHLYLLIIAIFQILSEKALMTRQLHLMYLLIIAIFSDSIRIGSHDTTVAPLVFAYNCNLSMSIRIGSLKSDMPKYSENCRLRI